MKPDENLSSSVKSPRLTTQISVADETGVRLPAKPWAMWDYPTWSSTLAAAKAGDAGAMERLCWHLLGWAERQPALRSVRNAQDREDIGIEFVEYLTREGVAHLRDVGPAGWKRHLYRGIEHFIHNWRGRGGKHRAVETLEVDCPLSTEEEPYCLADQLAGDSDPDELVARQMDRELLWAAMERLKEDDRRLLYLRYWNEMTTREIGERLGVPRGTVAKRLHDICRRLRKWLTEMET
jgi:RNA polymerase sigma factor (sigma-70 family)